MICDCHLLLGKKIAPVIIRQFYIIERPIKKFKAEQMTFLPYFKNGRLSQYIREAYEHTERKGHPQLAWKLEETVSIL